MVKIAKYFSMQSTTFFLALLPILITVHDVCCRQDSSWIVSGLCVSSISRFVIQRLCSAQIVCSLLEFLSKDVLLPENENEKIHSWRQYQHHLPDHCIVRTLQNILWVAQTNRYALNWGHSQTTVDNGWLLPHTCQVLLALPSFQQ